MNHLTYLTSLAEIRTAPIVPAPLRAAWWSGRSSYHDERLTIDQIELLQQLEPLGYQALTTNFPWTQTSATCGSHIPLPIASVRNWMQTSSTVLDARFRRELASRLQVLLDATDRLLLLAGSSGLHYFSHAWPLVQSTCRVHVIALGPVSTRLCPVDVTVITGRDPLSIMGYRGRRDHRVGCGHLGYARDRDVRRIVRDIAGRWRDA